MSAHARPACRAAVLSRYDGVAQVLADLLRRGGVDVVWTWAADEGAGPPVRPPDGVVVVVTLAPSDPSLDAVHATGWSGTTVGVTWHPRRELDRVPPSASLVCAGTIHQRLARVVRQAAGQPGEVTAG